MKDYRPGSYATPEEQDAYLEELLSDFDDPSVDEQGGCRTMPATQDPSNVTPAADEQPSASTHARVPPIASASESYRFPARDGGAYTGMSVNELKAALQRKIQIGFTTSGHWDYDFVRGDLCMIHLELNHLGRWAPKAD